MKLYHCSLSCIKNFNFDHGVHFGGKFSALEAALRKTSAPEDTIFIHHCNIDIHSFMEIDDQGCFENWLIWKDIALNQNIDIIRYNNKYEPDFSPSFYILKNRIVSIFQVEKISALDAEILLENNNFYI